MRKLLAIFLMIPILSFGQTDSKPKIDYKKEVKKIFKFATLFIKCFL